MAFGAEQLCVYGATFKVLLIGTTSLLFYRMHDGFAVVNNNSLNGAVSKVTSTALS